MAANGGVLSTRIGRLLGIKRAAGNMSVTGLAAIGGLCVAGVLMAGTTLARLQDTLPAAPASAVIAPIASAPIVTHVEIAPLTWAMPPVRLARLEARSAAERRSDETSAANSSPEQHGSYIEGLQSTGLKDLTVEEIIALKINGVTPDYIQIGRAACRERV